MVTEMSGRGNVSSGKSLSGGMFGWGSLRRGSVRSGNCLFGEMSIGEVSVGEMSSGGNIRIPRSLLAPSQNSQNILDRISLKVPNKRFLTLLYQSSVLVLLNTKFLR